MPYKILQIKKLSLKSYNGKHRDANNFTKLLSCLGPNYQRLAS